MRVALLVGVALLSPAAAPAKPSPEDLAGAFRFRATTTSPVGSWTRVVDIEGDATGANVSFRDTEHGKDVLRLHHLDAQRVKALLKEVDAQPWWSQRDQVSPKGALGSDQKLELERGATRHELHVAGGCSVPKKPCVTVELISALEELVQRLPDSTRRTFVPPERIVFRPAKSPAPRPPPPGTTQVVPGWDTRRDKRCYPDGKYSLCFHSPFEPGVMSSEAANVPTDDRIWALETANGLRCRESFDRITYSCELADGGAGGGLKRLVHLDAGVVAETTPDGRWVGVVRTWR